MIKSNLMFVRLLMPRESRVTHVLIIEDEPFVAMLLEDVLLDEGVDSIVIADCEDGAIGEARRQRPDFILSDVNLLQGTGPAAVATIIDEHGSIPVLFVTAWPDACAARRLPSRVLSKPISCVDVANGYRELMAPRH